jgi:selenocysteine lyase/cysteine desulfurase
MTCRAAFDLDDGVVWLNSAHQSALPRAAADAAAEAVRWKQRPWELSTERFSAVPASLRETIGGLIGAPAGEVMLSNGASFGLHAIAGGFPFEPGDDVVVMRGDFPSNILPWRLRERDGVAVRAIAPEAAVLTPDEVAAAIGPRTRVVCLSWVHSFSGHALDIEGIGAVCRRAGARFVVNATQALGVRSIDVTSAPIDALVVSGWKWLCGPYATGFFWVRPELLARLTCRQAYWLSMQTADDLAAASDPELPVVWGPRQFEIFGTANFFNVMPFQASVALVAGIGPAEVRRVVDELVDQLIAGIDADRYELVSPASGPSRSSLVVFADRRPGATAALYRRLREAGIATAHRRGNIRVSPHIYNTPDEIDRTLHVLRATGAG